MLLYVYQREQVNNRANRRRQLVDDGGGHDERHLSCYSNVSIVSFMLEMWKGLARDVDADDK